MGKQKICFANQKRKEYEKGRIANKKFPTCGERLAEQTIKGDQGEKFL